MKTIASIFIISILGYTVKAQMPSGIVLEPKAKDVSEMSAVDSGKIRIWYAMNAVDINNPDTYDDLQRLEIGARKSKYFSHWIFTSDSLATEWKKKNKNARSVPRKFGQGGKILWWSEYCYSEYFRDFPDNTFTEYARMPNGIPNYRYSEPVPVQNWDIRDDTLTVAGYACQKAVCSFRGRNYTAWFTMDIPIGIGPWKFGGLPGLIMKVYDERRQYAFECVKIENAQNKFPIMIYDYKNYGKMERKKLVQLQKDLHEDYFKFVDMAPTGNTKFPEKSVYHPMELE